MDLYTSIALVIALVVVAMASLLSGERTHQVGAPTETLVPYWTTTPSGAAFMVKTFKTPLNPSIVAVPTSVSTEEA